MTPGEQIKAASIGSASDRRSEERRAENGNGSVRITARHLKGLLALLAILGGSVGLYGQVKDGWPVIPNYPRENLTVERALATSPEFLAYRGKVDRLERKVLPYLDWLVQQEIRRQEREGRTVEPPRVE
jgi:hypothetical protein